MVLEDLFETDTFEELHRDEEADTFFEAKIVDKDDPWVSELVLCLCFSVKATDYAFICAEVCAQDFDRGVFAVIEVGRHVDEPHAAFSELFFETEVPNCFAYQWVGVAQIHGGAATCTALVVCGF